VRDDDIDTRIGDRQVLNFSEPKLHMREAAFFGMRPRFPQHFMRHVDANHAAGLSHGTRGKKTIEAGATAEIEHRYPWSQRRQGNRIAAA
jgi:hypothetical protein